MANSRAKLRELTRIERGTLPCVPLWVREPRPFRDQQVAHTSEHPTGSPSSVSRPVTAAGPAYQSTRKAVWWGGRDEERGRDKVGMHLVEGCFRGG